MQNSLAWKMINFRAGIGGLTYVILFASSSVARAVISHEVEQHRLSTVLHGLDPPRLLGLAGRGAPAWLRACRGGRGRKAPGVGARGPLIEIVFEAVRGI